MGQFSWDNLDAVVQFLRTLFSNEYASTVTARGHGSQFLAADLDNIRIALIDYTP
jgi:hypothetical protein